MSLTGEERDRRVLELYERVVEIEQRLIPTGLHVLGRNPSAEESADLLRMVVSFDRPERGARALPDLVAESLGLGAYKLILENKSDEGWSARERVDAVVKEAVNRFLVEGEDGAVELVVSGDGRRRTRGAGCLLAARGACARS